MERSLPLNIVIRDILNYAKTTRGIGNLFTSTAEQRAVVMDERGNPVDSLPVYFVGNPRTEEELTTLENEITNLKEDYKAGRIKQPEYDKKISLLKGKYNKLRAKPALGDLNLDMETVLKKFAGMAEHYETMGTIEDTMKSMMKVLEMRVYQPADPLLTIGKFDSGMFKEKGEKLGKGSNIYKRAAKFMSMVYYDEEKATKGMMDKIADGAIQWSSLAYVAFNPFGSFLLSKF